MKRLAIVLVAVALLAIVAWRARPRPLEFAPSFGAALETARADDAWVVVHLRRADRPLGTKMDVETLADRSVQLGAHDGFVHVRLDAERDSAIVTPLAGDGAALSTLVVDRAGELVARADGFLGARELLAFLARVRAAKPRIEAAERALAADSSGNESDGAQRLDLARSLDALGASERAEREAARAELDLATARNDMSRALEAARFRAELLERRGQLDAAAQLRRDADARYRPAPR